jgi:hypothetical protein
VLALGVLFHPLEPRVVVRELVQVRERDLPRYERVVVRDVRQEVVESVLELDIHATAKLVDVEGRTRPVDPDLLADSARLVVGEAVGSHAVIVSRIAVPGNRVKAERSCGFPATGMWPPRDATCGLRADHKHVERSYGVVWKEGSRGPVTGKLELLPRELRLEGLDSTRTVPYEDVASIRVGRSASDRINGGASVVVERRLGDPITIATVAQPSLVGEIAERLAALQLGARTSRRVVVIVPLKPGANASVSRLLKQGPPFDPRTIEGLDWHEVFLTSDEAVFVFESQLGAGALTALLGDPKLWEAAVAWGEHVAGPPRIAESVFSWSRGEPAEDVSFLPTPGPGDSDGGDIY